jgi:cation diffusion facilitator family transporter
MPNYDWSDDGYFPTETRDLKRIRRVLIITMLLNFLATAVKLAAGLATGAISIVADAMDSFFDGVSNVVGLTGLHIAKKPPDADHPYGHRKYETIAALTIAFLLFLTTWQLLQTAWDRFREGAEPSVNIWTLGAMILSMLIQAGTSFYEMRAGQRLNSEVLIADARHTRASILVSLSVLGGLLFVQLGYPQADALIAAVVALVIAKIGIDILRETLPVLVDQAPLDPGKIAEVVSSVGGVESFHRVRSRGAQDSVAVDLHVRVSPDKTMQAADAIASEVRRRLLAVEGIRDVTVHVEAQRERSSNESDIFASLTQAAAELGLVIHESGLHRLDGHLFLEFHVGVNPSLTLGEAHELVDHLEREIRIRAPEIEEVYSHIELSSTLIEEGERVPQQLASRIQHEVERIVNTIPSVNDPHNIIVRQAGVQSDRLHIFLECTISPDTPLVSAHDLSTQIEREILSTLGGEADVFIHLEPPDQVRPA